MDLIPVRNVTFSISNWIKPDARDFQTDPGGNPSTKFRKHSYIFRVLSKSTFVYIYVSRKNNGFALRLYVGISYLEKNSKTTATKKLSLLISWIFPWFWVDFDNFTSFFATLHRHQPHNDGNQLPGCRLFSRYDVYIFLWKHNTFTLFT